MTIVLILVWALAAGLAIIQLWALRTGRISGRKAAMRLAVHAIFLAFLTYALAHPQ